MKGIISTIIILKVMIFRIGIMVVLYKFWIKVHQNLLFKHLRLRIMVKMGQKYN